MSTTHTLFKFFQINIKATFIVIFIISLFTLSAKNLNNSTWEGWELLVVVEQGGI